MRAPPTTAGGLRFVACGFAHVFLFDNVPGLAFCPLTVPSLACTSAPCAPLALVGCGSGPFGAPSASSFAACVPPREPGVLGGFDPDLECCCGACGAAAGLSIGSRSTSGLSSMRITPLYVITPRPPLKCVTRSLTSVSPMWMPRRSSASPMLCASILPILSTSQSRKRRLMGKSAYFARRTATASAARGGNFVSGPASRTALAPEGLHAAAGLDPFGVDSGFAARQAGR